MFKFIYKNDILNFLIVMSVIALGGAYISEYALGLTPCVLCYYQRYAYWGIIIICLLCVWLQKYSKKLSMVFTIMAIIGVCVEIAIAFFHMGVEYQWFEMLSSCKGSINYLDSISSLETIPNEVVVPCDKPQFVYVLSMAGWNVLYALLMLVVSLILYVRNVRNAESE